MKQAKIVALLGRPLTPVEATNFDLYIDIAKSTVADLLCMNLDSATEARTFDIRDGYKTVFTDIFTNVTNVEVDGTVLDTTEYSLRQWDKRTGTWFNSIVFTDSQTGEVSITADWGFDCFPVDLKMLIAKAFAQISTKNTSNSLVSSKQVEDFRISFRTDVSLEDLFIQDNLATINKYSLCHLGNMRQGSLGC